MRPKVKTARREASQLYGATAGYVSIVDRGANETPFQLIKSKDGAKAMTIKKRGKSKAAKSHKTVNRDRKTAPEAETKSETLVAKMVFSADVFEDEQDVRNWITEAEWDAEDITITKDADGNFTARPGELLDKDFERLGEVAVDDEGVSAYVGERKIFLGDDEDYVQPDDKAAKTADDPEDDDGEADNEDEDDDDGEADDEDEDDDDDDDPIEKGVAKKVAKTPAPVVVSKRAAYLKKRQDARTTARKFDTWDAMFSDANTLAGVLKSGMDYDNVPPGAVEVQFAFNAAVGNILQAEDAVGRQDALNKAALEYAEIIGGLDTFFSAYVEMEAEDLEKHVKDAAERNLIAKWAEDFADHVAEGQPAVVNKSAKMVAKEAVAPLAIDYSKVADLVAKAVEPLSERVEAVSGTVEALATRRPSKKASAPEDAGTAAPPNPQKAEKASDPDWVRAKQSKALLG